MPRRGGGLGGGGGLKSIVAAAQSKQTGLSAPAQDISSSGPYKQKISHN